MAKPAGDFFGGRSIDFALPYFSISVSLNVLLTILICGKLFHMQKNAPTASSGVYTSVMAMIVESVAPTAIIGLVFIVLYGKKNPIAYGILLVWAGLMVCPQHLSATGFSHRFGRT